MKSKIKNICISIYNLKNGPFWKRGEVEVEKHGTNIVFDNVKVKSFGKNNKIVIGDGVRLHKIGIELYGSNNTIVIEENYSLNNTLFVTEEDNNYILLGKGTTTTGGDVFSAIEGKKIIVGNDGMISRDVWFFTGDGHGIINNDGIRINYSDDIIIGKHVWIGYRAILTKGCKICDNSIIAAGAVCNRGLNPSIMNHCIIGGNPARIISRNIDWTRDRKDGETQNA